MSVSEPFIDRPIATSLLMAAVLLLGMLGYNFLSISALPAVDFPTIQVTTQYPGASPDVMGSLVTTPLERQFGQISGVSAMISDSSYGVSNITLQFGLDRNIDAAAQDVQAAINAAKGTLPSNLPYPPTYNKVNPADTPILSLSVSSETLSIDKVNDFADTVLGQKLSQVSGVGLVTIEGNQKPAVRVQANPTALTGLGLGLEDVRTALGQANVNQPKGSFNGSSQSYTIGSNDQIGSAAEFQPIIVAYSNGGPVRLSDVANVVDGVENDELAAWVGNQPAVLLDIRRQPGANIIQTVDAIKKLLPQLEASIPASVKVKILSDRTETIRASVSDVQFTLMLTVVLVVMVIFVFLRKLWATVIPSIALPISLIGTFGVMALCGFSLDNLSLMALTIATGFVVDDAIVMIENIVRYIEEGKEPEEAARLGSRQIGFTVISLTISLIAVFIPLLLMPGIVGRLFNEFALVLSIAVILSAVVSLTLTPMMCAKLLKREDPKATAGEGGRETRANRLFRWSESLFDRALAGYERSLHWVMARQFATLMVAIATLVLTIFLYIVIPKGLIPQQDTGVITGVTEADQSISFAAMVARSHALADVVRKDPDVLNVSAFVGAGTVNTTLNSGTLTIVLKSRDKRSSSAQEIIDRLKDATTNVQGISLYMQPVQDLQIDSRVSRTQYQYVLQDTDPVELNTWVPKLLKALQQRPELSDVASDQQAQGLQLSLTIDRDRASQFGVPVQAIDDTLYDAFGQRQISTIYTEQNQYRVILEVAPEFRMQPDTLDKLYVKANTASLTTAASSNASAANSAAANSEAAKTTSTSSAGSSTTTSQSGTSSASSSSNANGFTLGSSNMVPLSTFVQMKTVTGPLVVTHQGQLSAATVSFNLAAGESLSDAVKAIDEAKQDISLPSTVTASYSGSAAEFQSSLSSEPYLILAALIVIYIVLGVLYESYIHPVTILSTLPSAGVGALLALLLTGQDLSIVALIGIILLIGIVKKNAIMMIDFALDAERNQGMGPEESIFRAAVLRFRPIMMTTMAALLAAVPLAISNGTGSELRKPLGISIVGGLLLSQVLTLYTTPVIYLYMDRLAARLRNWRAPRAPDYVTDPPTL